MQARGRSRSEEAGVGGVKRRTRRDSSASSTASREVRCACQFFQSDSLLPERSALLASSRPPSRTGAMAAKLGDHEYEPIAPPPEKKTSPSPLPQVMVEDTDVTMLRKGREGSPASTGSREQRFLRAPLDDNVVVPADGDVEEAAMAGRELGDTVNGDDDDKDMTTHELQAHIEERYFAATPTTTESRTDCDVNTSQLDSSGLEDLPLKRDARKKRAPQAEIEEQQSTARGLQQRLRSQAGRLRSKIRNMSRPKFSKPEMPKFNLPERPKFNLPERPKFNLPERPKFSLPERPKFNLPERPKFSLPERPKFNLPDRPRFSLPDRPKFSFTAKSKTTNKKTTSSTKRPLRDRVSTESSASSKKGTGMFDFDFKTYPRIFDRKSKRGQDYATSSPKAPRSLTPPPQMPARKKGPVGQRWLHRFTDIKYADDDNLQRMADEDAAAIDLRKASMKVETSFEERDSLDKDDADLERPDSPRTESMSEFQDKDFAYAITLEKNNVILRDQNNSMQSDREQRSSGSSSDRRRAGVLEEIDSDEFFLREKGLSQDDVNVGRFLTFEIREAFGSPNNALTQMDKYDEENEENLGHQYRGTPEREPTRPVRTRSLRPRKKTGKPKTPSPTEEIISPFNTYPPMRPKRVRKPKEEVEEQQEATDDKIDVVQESEFIKQQESFGEVEVSAEEEALQGVNITELPDENIPDDKQELEKGSLHPTFTIESFQDQSLLSPEEEENLEVHKDWHMDIDQPITPPMAPKRKRRLQKEFGDSSQMLNGSYTKEDWIENVEDRQISSEQVVERYEPDYIIPAAPDDDEMFEAPVPPKRGRRKSSRGPSIQEDDRISRDFPNNSLMDEDRTSREAESLPFELTGDDAILNDIGLDEMDGYASVEKPSKPERPRRPKHTRPSVPGRRKRSNGHAPFFSLPRRAIRPAPVRPVRNYSTLGPSRPPRKSRVIVDHEYVEQERQSESYMEIDDRSGQSPIEESQDSGRDLQSGDVIEKMKGRPLPPPPRPPRKSRDGKEILDDFEDINITDKIPLDVDEMPIGVLNDDVFYLKQSIGSTYENDIKTEIEVPLHKDLSSLDGVEEFEEISVATQTDPLPDDVCVIPGDVEEQPPVTYADATTETNGTLLPKMDILQPTEVTEEILLQQIPSLQATPISPRTSESIKSSEQQAAQQPIIVEKPVPYYVMPDPDTEIELKAQRLQVSELDVERLNVGELQAQKILVSDIDGMSMQVAELTSKSGHLVVSGLELPPGFLQELYESLPQPIAPQPPAVTSTSPQVTTSHSIQPQQVISVSEPIQQVQAECKQDEGFSPSVEDKRLPAVDPSQGPPSSSPSSQIAQQPINVMPPPVPPPPTVLSQSPQTEYIPEYIPTPPRSSSHSRVQHPSQQRELESEEEMISMIPSSHTRRRRHHQQKPVVHYSTDEEEEEEYQPYHPPRRQISRGGEQSVGELGRQLFQISHGIVSRVARHTMQFISTAASHLQESDDARRDMQTAICILLVVVAALIFMGLGSGKSFHYHHWDYLFPPPGPR